MYNCEFVKDNNRAMSRSIHIIKDGHKYWYKADNYPKEKILHRKNGPAIEYANGDKLWYINGELHREDGPAKEYVDGIKAWYINGELHREDGPAKEYSDGSKSWYISGKSHREDGPAVECANGNKYYFLFGKQYSKEEYDAHIKTKFLFL